MKTIEQFRVMMAAECREILGTGPLDEPEDMQALEKQVVDANEHENDISRIPRDHWPKLAEAQFASWKGQVDHERQKTADRYRETVDLRSFVRRWRPGSTDLMKVRRAMLATLDDRVMRDSAAFSEPYRMSPEQWHQFETSQAARMVVNAESKYRRAKAVAVLRLELRAEYEKPTLKDGPTPEESAKRLWDSLEGDHDDSVLRCLAELLVQSHGGYVFGKDD
jgi:hypothetical protein